ncbi:MAG: hypothetical protein ACM3O6_07225, partial [Acidobacteriota bacterium]
MPARSAAPSRASVRRSSSLVAADSAPERRASCLAQSGTVGPPPPLPSPGLSFGLSFGFSDGRG